MAGADLDCVQYTVYLRGLKIAGSRTWACRLNTGSTGSWKAVHDGEGGEHEGQDDYFDELTEF